MPSQSHLFLPVTVKVVCYLPYQYKSEGSLHHTYSPAVPQENSCFLNFCWHYFLKAKSFIDSGALVPDKVISELLNNRIKQEDCKRGFILDGYPRTVEQAKELGKILNREKNISLNFHLLKSIYLQYFVM